MVPRRFRILRRRRETKETFSLELEPCDREVDLAFGPGQFNMVYVFGNGEVPISICGNPETLETLHHTVRAVGPVTEAMSRLSAGDVVGIRGPFGHGWPLEEAKGNDVVLVAGGIGLAPLRPALYAIAAHRGSYGRVVLLYGARTPKDILYWKELQQWRSRFDLDVEVAVDIGLEDWRGNVGLVTELVSWAPFDAAQTVAFVCGPEIMMRFTVQALVARGVSVETIFVSMERNMKCAVGFCGHCQLGPSFLCKDGPVLPYDRVSAWLDPREM